MKKQLLLVLFAFAAATQAWAQQPGSLDASFSGKGIKNVVFDTNTQTEFVTASFLQPDGKLLVAYLSTNGTDTTSYVSRFLSDGKEDATFGRGGKKQIDLVLGASLYFEAHSIALQNDGTIILGGVRRSSDYIYPCLVSLKSDGSYNEAFGNGDSYLTFSVEEWGEVIFTVQVHKATGNIYASGGDVTQGYGYLFTACISSTGQLISSFGGNGTGIATYGFYDAPHDIARASVIKGNILYIAGSARDNADPQKRHFGLLAINTTDGSFVRDFFYSTDGESEWYGKVTIPLAADAPGADNYCTALKFSPDSTSLFLGGYTIASPTDVNFMLAKVNLKNGGYIDNAFSGDGVITYRMADTFQNYLRTLDIEPNGKMMLGGTLTNSLSYWTALRVLPNGTIDNTFGTAGRKVYDGNNGNSLINTFNLVGLHYNKSSQKYLFVGHYNNLDPFRIDGLLKQINNNGSPDTGYGSNSEKAFSGAAENAYIKDITVRSDGKIIVGGRSGNETTLPVQAKDVVKRFNADGSDDQSLAVYISSLVPALPNALIVDIEAVANNKLLVAGQYKNPLDEDSLDFFILRLNENGTLDTDFSGDGYDVRNLSSRDDYVQGIAVHSDGSIIVYGYIFNQAALPFGAYNIALIRYSPAGAFDTGFGTMGKFLYSYSYGTPDDVTKDVDVKIKSDGKIVVACNHVNAQDRESFVVFRLTSTGVLDTGFGLFNSGVFIEETNMIESHATASLCIRSDGKILVGGASTYNSDRDYAMILLNADGAALDASFGNKSGLLTLPKGNQEFITYVTVDNSKILATGGYLSNGKLYTTLLRFSLLGVLDPTFMDKGHTVVGESYNKSALVSGNKLYFAGADRKLDGATVYNGVIYRFNLGTGPSVKTTTLTATNYNKFLGDEPFLIETVTNSPAAKNYTISSNAGGCVTVHPTTGLVTMTCATVNTGPVTVRVIQPVTTGYTADTAFSTINVGKGIPKIVFNAQGDTVGTNFKLKVQSTSDGYPEFYISSGDYDSLYVYYDGETYTYGEGCVQVQVYYYETNNYLSASAYATVCAYEKLIVPAAFDDQVNLAYPVEAAVSLNPLANDEAYTGNLDPAGLDLDPSKAGVQHQYVSPALGKFEADTVTGVVTYTPFQGFVGSGSIDYVVYDSKNSASPVAKIFVTVTAPVAEIPALKATELFTPNNDGLNDAFVIGNTQLGKTNQLIIFDRNGAELFTKNDYINDWTGELSNGKTAENGIYYYIFTEEVDGEKTRELKGVVELRR